MKKIWPILFVPLFAFAPASSAQFACITNNGTITITGYDGPGRALVIPSTLGGVPVTGIGDRAFADITRLTSVAISASITSIGEGPFADCILLKTITVNKGNPNYTSVGGVLFDKSQATLIQYPPHKAGTSYKIPDSVTIIGDNAFDASDYLKSVTIPSGVTSIGNGAFFLTQLESITIPGDVTNIGAYAFEDCALLTSVYFEGNAPAIGLYSFETHSGGNTTAYYLAGASGWGDDDTFAYIGIPTALWVPQSGSLEVTITPAAAVGAGAGWQVDDGATNESGTIVADLAAGDHVVTYTPIPGGTAPAAQTVRIKNGETTKVTGHYGLERAAAVDTLTFGESFDDVIRPIAGEPGNYGVEPETQGVQASGAISLAGVDISQFDRSTAFSLTIGEDYEVTHNLGDDPKYEPGKSTSATIEDARGAVVIAHLKWTSERLTILIVDHEPLFDFYEEYDGTASGRIGDSTFGNISFGPASVDFDNVSLTGTVRTRTVEKAGSAYTLSTISLKGTGTAD